MDANENRVHRLGRWAFPFLLFPLLANDSAPAPDPHELARRIAGRYGVEAFPRVESIRFTFNVAYKGKDVARDWTWFPREDSVLYKGKDAGGATIQVAYSRKNVFSLSSEAVKAVDKMFINDQYWLLFPMHLVWDKGTAMEAEALPRGKDKEAYRLTVTYPKEGGYTPGDAYDLFVDSSGAVRRWIFRKGNTDKPTREARWSEPVPAGNLRLSLERPGMEGDGFRLSFSNVDVESE